MKRNIILIISLALLAGACGKKTQETSPQRMDITETVFAPGTLEPEGKYNLTAQTDGYLRELRFEEGDTIKTDQLLAVIDNGISNVNAASAEELLRIASLNAGADGPAVQQALQNAGLAHKKNQEDSLQLQRYEKLAATNSVSKVELENVRLAYESSRTNWLNALQNYTLALRQGNQQVIAQRAQRDMTAITGGYNELRAVVGGKIYKKLKERGDYVRRGEVIAVIGDADSVYALFNVDEENISKVRTGQQAIVQLNTSKDENIDAAITEINPSFDERSQSFVCKARFTKSPPHKIAGTQLQANIIVGRNKNALVIPRKYIDFAKQVNVKGKGPVTVKTGFVSGNWVEVLDSISEKDIIVTDNLQ